jgi:hypothetical protein
MGAETTYRVKVLRLVEDEIEVSAVTGSEALEIAAKEPGVARAVEVLDHPAYRWAISDDCMEQLIAIDKALRR